MAPDPEPIEPTTEFTSDRVPSGETGLSSRPAATPGPDRDLIVSMQDVSRKFDGREVLSGINLTVPRGTILGVIGPSGAGKTTTIRMLTGAIAPSSGEVSVMGRAPRKFRRADRERIGYMPQAFTLYEDLTAGENIDFVASLFGMLWRRRRRRVAEVLKLVELWDVRGRQAGRLSGGMQRRLELACALVHEPELIILDEPTAGIDPLLRGSIWDELHRLRNAGRTLLVTTQHISEADECDAVAMIVGGRIIALAPPEELRRLATNGDLLDIETSVVYDGSLLAGTPGVREVTQDGPRHLRVVVDDAGTSLPEVVDRIRASGAEVDSAREQRLSFDEIFAILVARDRRRRAEPPAAPDDLPPTDRHGRGGNDRNEAAA
ncbi:MAG TPA: ABC transporter ATP-binding protein [Verrucomicrobiae bacterium]|jgi:ABC-2 type transport system ATP-binding protein|nr:ABC transporter ATP-binding protein [Verrucomicrobiae bacterium]